MANIMAGYRIQLLVNGQPVDTHQLGRQHDARDVDQITMSGTARLLLKKGDIVQLRLVVENPGRKLEYIVLPGGSNFKGERQRLW